MSSDEAVKSTDPVVVYRTRTVIKGQVTSAIKKLERILVKTEAGIFDHCSLNRSELVHAHKKLEDNFKMLQKLHLR